jgi:hypothetical protein
LPAPVAVSTVASIVASAKARIAAIDAEKASYVARDEERAALVAIVAAAEPPAPPAPPPVIEIETNELPLKSRGK